MPLVPKPGAARGPDALPPSLLSLGLRLRRELRLHAERRPMGPEVLVRELSAIERSRLKDAFRAVRGWQEQAAFQMGVET